MNFDSQIVWFALFAVALYFIVSDESIAAAFYYVTKIVKAYAERQWWWLTHNPRNPVVKYFMYRRSLKLAKELQEYFDENK